MTIIEKLKLNNPAISNDYLDKVRNCGFSVPTPGYPQITPEAIFEYLKFAAKENLKNLKKPWFGYRFSNVSENSWFDKNYHIRYRFGLANFNEMETYWVEQDITKCRMFPPEHVLTSIEKAKKDFDEIKIATVEHMRDPLVVGINKGDRIRYLIDWWDDDIDITKLEIK
jgi:hypothetical protein